MELGRLIDNLALRLVTAAAVGLMAMIPFGMPESAAQQKNGDSTQQAPDFKPAVLKVVTNFNKADVTVNGMQYPEYVENTDKEGMVLPAGGPYTVEVTYDGKTKTYQIALEPYRIRILMVELTGFKGGNVRPGNPRDSQRSKTQPKKNDQDPEYGQLTVYSKPKGGIIIDGEPYGQDTPGTIKVEPGRHDVKIKYKNGETSETKSVRVRKGQRLKLFFRD